MIKVIKEEEEDPAELWKLEKKDLDEKILYLSGMLERKEKDWQEQFDNLQLNIDSLQDREDELNQTVQELDNQIIQLQEKKAKYKRKYSEIKKSSNWHAFLDKESEQAKAAEEKSRKQVKVE